MSNKIIGVLFLIICLALTGCGISEKYELEGSSITANYSCLDLNEETVFGDHMLATVTTKKELSRKQMVKVVESVRKDTAFNSVIQLDITFEGSDYDKKEVVFRGKDLEAIVVTQDGKDVYYSKKEWIKQKDEER